jgi:hypothetical protein
VGLPYCSKAIVVAMRAVVAQVVASACRAPAALVVGMTLVAASKLLSILVPNMRDGLTEIDLYASVVHQGIVHFQIGFRRLGSRRKTDKSILQGRARIAVCNQVHLDIVVVVGGVEARKDELQVVRRGDWIELTDKQDGIGWSNTHGRSLFRGRGRRWWRQIPEQFQHHCPTVILLAEHRLLALIL